MESPTPLLSRLSKNRSLRAFLLLIAITAHSQAFSFPADKQRLTVEVVDHVIKNQYDSAFSVIHRFSTDRPDPLPALLHLAILGMRDVDFDQIIDSARFLASYDTASSQLAHWEQRNGVSSYSRTLSGMCKAMHAAFYLRQKKYVTAMQNGFGALDDLREAQELDSTNHEVDFFLGLYEYARAELRSRLWWVLFWYPGNRERGIERVRQCSQKAILTGEAAKLSLCDMYIEENRPEEAKQVIDVLKRKYSDSRFVLWAQAKYFEAIENSVSAAIIYGHLAKSYGNEPEGEFNTLTTMVKQASFLYESGDVTASKTVCNNILSHSKIDAYKRLKKETVKLSERCDEAADQ